ncbi:LysR family transcriptional regulator substrate-binding protein, partial [Lactococcus lactis]|uniref:LysR family transcriptional regulator substrate-binding protein n=1 Tax=Lactococcus lactis TaxID=1358 RepID=UPI00215100F9
MNTEIMNAEADETQHIRFGISQTVSRILFSKIAKQLKSDFPELSYDVEVSNSEGVLNQLEGYKIDVGII